jgi:hypothetical protein
MSGLAKGARMLRQAQHERMLCMLLQPTPLSLSLSKAAHNLGSLAR